MNRKEPKEPKCPYCTRAFNELHVCRIFYTRSKDEKGNEVKVEADMIYCGDCGAVIGQFDRRLCTRTVI